MKHSIRTLTLLAATLTLTAVTPASAGEGSLVTHYPMDGNALDAAGANHATTVNATLTDDRFGNALSAFAFDGTTSYIEVPYDVSLDVDGWRSGTVTAWFRASSIPSTGQRQILRDIWDDDLDGVMLYITSSGMIGGQWRDGSATNNRVVIEGGEVRVDTWHHVAMVYDDEQGTLYFDAAPIGTFATETGGLLHRANPLILGGTPAYTQLFEGDLDEIRLYDYPLRASDVAALGAMFADGFESGDTSRW